MLYGILFNKQIGKASLDYSSAVVCPLDEMLRCGAIKSVPNFFEEIFSFAEHNSSDDPTWGFSDKQGKRYLGAGLMGVVMSLLPKSVSQEAQKAKHLVIHDLSPSTS